MRDTISVIFPAYNEEASIVSTVSKARDFLKEAFKDFEIIIVNDGSCDRTGSLSREIAERFTKIKVIEHQENLGYAVSINDGLRLAEFELVFFSDSDGQFDTSEIRKLLEFIDEYDIVIGYRKTRRDPIVRKISSFFYNLIIRTFFKLDFKDFNCAFKLFKKNAINRIELKTKGYLVNVELIAKAKELGMRIKEVPITHYPRSAGHSKFGIKDILIGARELYSLKVELAYIRKV